jgi:hypothetical protein
MTVTDKVYFHARSEYAYWCHLNGESHQRIADRFGVCRGRAGQLVQNGKRSATTGVPPGLYLFDGEHVTARARNVLASAKVKTWEQVATSTWAEWPYNCGKKTAAEIKTMLAKRGLSFAVNPKMGVAKTSRLSGFWA